ncbi:hypothetical protein TUN199_11684, partial [Pyrenophora tritici-repentis]
MSHSPGAIELPEPAALQPPKRIARAKVKKLSASIEGLDEETSRLQKVGSDKQKVFDVLHAEQTWEDKVRLDMDAQKQKMSQYRATIRDLQKRPTAKQWKEATSRIDTLRQRPTTETLRPAATAATDPIQRDLDTRIQECERLKKRPTKADLKDAVAKAELPLEDTIRQLKKRSILSYLDDSVNSAKEPLEAQIKELEKRPTDENLAEDIKKAKQSLQDTTSKLEKRPTQQALTEAVAAAKELEKRPTDKHLAEAVEQAKRSLQYTISKLESRPTQRDLAVAVAAAEGPLQVRIDRLDQDLSHAVAAHGSRLRNNQFNPVTLLDPLTYL